MPVPRPRSAGQAAAATGFGNRSLLGRKESRNSEEANGPKAPTVSRSAAPICRTVDGLAALRNILRAAALFGIAKIQIDRVSVFVLFSVFYSVLFHVKHF